MYRVAREIRLSLPITTQGSSDFSSYEVIPQVEELIRHQKTPTMPCYLRKPHERNPNFVGRNDVMSQIDKALLPPEGPPNSSGLRSFALCGFGGPGKSQIAVQYAFEREESFDAIFWVQADESTKLAKSFDQIAQALGLVSQADSGDRVVSRNVVMEWLCNPRKLSTAGESHETPSKSSTATWLLVCDNADKIELLRDGYWPLPDVNGAILVTTRDPLAKTDLTNSGIDLSPMPAEDCGTLLRKLTLQTSGSNVEEASKALAERIGCVPLAVKQIAAAIRRKDMTIEEFLTEYGDSPLFAELKRVEDMPQQDQYKFTLSSVWGFENFSPSALSLVNLLSVMDPDQIVESILDRNISQDVLQDYPVSSAAYINARTELLKTSLVRRNKDEKVLSLHRLVQEVAKSKMGETTLLTNFLLAIQLLSQAWLVKEDRFNMEDVRKDEADKVLPHVFSIHQLYLDYRHWILPGAQKRQLVTLLQDSGW